MTTDDVVERVEAIAAIRRFATPRPVSDDSPRRARTGASLPGRDLACARPALQRGPSSGRSGGAPYLQAVPRMAYQVRPEPLPANRSRIAPDLLALAVILAVVLAASLAGVRLP